MANPLCGPSEEATSDRPITFHPTNPPARVAREARPNPKRRGIVLVEDDDESSLLLLLLLLLLLPLPVPPPPKSAPSRIHGVANLMDNPWRFREEDVPPGERTPTLARPNVMAMAVTGAPSNRPMAVEFPNCCAATPTAERAARFPQESSAATRLLLMPPNPKRAVLVVVVVVIVVIPLADSIVVGRLSLVSIVGRDRCCACVCACVCWCLTEIVSDGFDFHGCNKPNESTTSTICEKTIHERKSTTIIVFDGEDNDNKYALFVLLFPNDPLPKAIIIIMCCVVLGLCCVVLCCVVLCCVVLCCVVL
jgi:hypothetical protein